VDFAATCERPSSRASPNLTERQIVGTLGHMRGIVAWGTYLPFWRLDRSTNAAIAGQGGGRGTRTVASYDEDPTTMAVEASRRALRTSGAVPDLALFATVSPAYADRTNATALHAALRLPDTTAAFDAGLSSRSAIGALLLTITVCGLLFEYYVGINRSQAQTLGQLAAQGDAPTSNRKFLGE